MPKPKGPPPVPPEWNMIPGLDETDINHKIKGYYNMAKLAKEYETNRKAMGEEIQAMLMAAGEKTVGVAGLRCTLSKGRSASQLSAQILLESGVDADVIAAATIPGTPYTYITVGPIDKPLREDDSGNRD